MQRTQLYLDEADTAVIDAQAREQGTTRSEIVRSLIAEHVARLRTDEASRVARQKSALLSLAGIAPYLGDEIADLRRGDERRARELDARWEASW